MATPEQHDAEHTDADQPEAYHPSARRLLIGLVAAGVALLAVTVAVLKVVNPSLAVLPPVIREPAGVPMGSASGPAHPTPDLAAVTLPPTASVTVIPSRPPASPHPVSPPAPLSYEAEAADLRGVQPRSVAGASGGKVVGRLESSNDRVTFLVTVPAAGRHTMTVYYIAGGQQSRAFVTVNSGTPAPARFASTGDWDTVKSLVLPIDLAAGENRIRFTPAGGGALDLDRITLSR